MSHFWNNKNGTIAISKMDDNYINNAIRFCEKNDMTLVEGNGGGCDIDDCWYDEEEIDLSETYERLKLEVRLRILEKRLEKQNIQSVTTGNEKFF